MTIWLARQALAGWIGTFALVFAGCGAIMSTPRPTRSATSAWRSPRPGDHGHDLCGRAHLGRPLQPGGHVRVRADTPLPLAAGGGLLAGAAGGRAGGGAGAARLARERGACGSDAAQRLRRAGVSVGERAHVLPDVRDHGRGHRHARGRRGGSDRGRRDGRSRRAVRRPDLRRLDEPRSLAGSGARRRRLHGHLGVHRSAAARAAVAAAVYQFLRAEAPTQVAEQSSTARDAA